MEFVPPPLQQVADDRQQEDAGPEGPVELLERRDEYLEERLPEYVVSLHRGECEEVQQFRGSGRQPDPEQSRE